MHTSWFTLLPFYSLYILLFSRMMSRHPQLAYMISIMHILAVQSSIQPSQTMFITPSAISLVQQCQTVAAACD